MKAIIEEGSPETGQKMQLLALAEGALPVHLLSALYIKSSENRLLMQRQLSRHLIGKTIFSPFGPILAHFSPFLVHISLFRPIYAHFGPYCHILVKLGLFWPI